MKFILYLILVVFFFSCSKPRHTDMLHGVWKVNKVEVLKGPELKKTIKEDCQYWSIDKRSRISIFDSLEVQSILHIKFGNGRFSSLDPGTGLVKEEFVIEKLNRDRLELCSKQQLSSGEYYVVYYLEKVNDSIAEEIKVEF